MTEQQHETDLPTIHSLFVLVFFLIGQMPSDVMGERESSSAGSGWFSFYNVLTRKGVWMWSSSLSPSLLTEVASPCQAPSQGTKPAKNPSALVMHLVSKGHQPVWKVTMPWIRCMWPNLGHKGQHQGGKSGRARSRSPDPPPHCSAPPSWQRGPPWFVESISKLAAGAARISQSEKQVPHSIGGK